MPTGIDLALTALTLVAVAGYVFWPLLRANATDQGWAAEPPLGITPAQRALEERRDAALRTLRDLDADHALMRISDEDYAAERALAVAEAAECLRALEGGRA